MGDELVGRAVLGAYARKLIRFKAGQLARKSGFQQSEQEDLEQELTLHLLRQAHHFDPQRASLSTFIDRVVNSRVVSLLRDRHRQKRAPGYTAQSLDTPPADSVSPSDLAGSLTEADHCRRIGQSATSEERGRERTIDVSEALTRLSPELRDLCRRLMAGSVASVARDLGVSRRQIQKAVGQIRTHFESMGLGSS